MTPLATVVKQLAGKGLVAIVADGPARTGRRLLG